MEKDVQGKKLYQLQHGFTVKTTLFFLKKKVKYGGKSCYYKVSKKRI